MRVKAKFKKVHIDAIIPSFKKDRDSGFDLCSIHDGFIRFGEVTVVSTGLTLELNPDLILKDYIITPDDTDFTPFTFELQVRPRSGLALKEGITVVNSPGTVDNGFRGEIKIILTRVKKGKYFFEKGERIAQGVVVPVLTHTGLIIEEVDKISGTDRGEGGYGHTGK